MDASERLTCPVCGNLDLVHCLTIPRVPVFCNVLFSDRKSALAAHRDLDLRYCAGCGHLHNAAFDPKAVQYSADYENSLHHSPRFQDYTRTLAAALHGRHRLGGKTVAEIASGQGDFLRELAASPAATASASTPPTGGPPGSTAGWRSSRSPTRTTRPGARRT